MRVNIITNLTSGCGLAHDYFLLRSVLEGFGYEVAGIDFQNHHHPIRRADLNIFLEVVVPSLFRHATKQWLMPNPEWWPENVDLTVFERILCKTRSMWYSVRELPPSVGSFVNMRARYTGFVSRDLYDSTVARLPWFLHVAGKSEMKNTEAVLAAWRGLSHQLTVITHWPAIAHKVQMANLPNVDLFYQATEPELRRMLNEYRFHVCPSKTEGWGHYIHEALGVGAAVLTTDAPPMNQISGLRSDLLIPARESGRLRKATLYDVDVQGLRDTVEHAATLHTEDLYDTSVNARSAFRREWDGFRERLTDVLGEVTW